MTRPFVLGIMGPSCSGKTTICARLAQSLPATIVQMDWYYRGTSTFKTKHGYPNAEDPSCIDFALLASHIRALQAGDEVAFTTVRKGERVHLRPAPVIVVEGFLLFCDPDVRDMMDLRVFIDIPEEEVVRRKIARARSALSRNEQYVRLLTVGEYRVHGLPMRKYAQVFLDGLLSPDENAKNILTAVARKRVSD